MGSGHLHIRQDSSYVHVCVNSKEVQFNNILLWVVIEGLRCVPLPAGMSFTFGKHVHEHMCVCHLSLKKKPCIVV